MCARPQTQRERRAFTSKALKALVQSPVLGSKGGLRSWMGWGRRSPSLLLPRMHQGGTRGHPHSCSVSQELYSPILLQLMQKQLSSWIHAGRTHLGTTGKVENVGSSLILLENSRRVLYMKLQPEHTAVGITPL